MLTTLESVDDTLKLEIDRLSKDDQFWSLPNNDKREQVRAFFQYPAMMVPSVQRHLINSIVILQPSIRSMLDPFVGAGTTITAGMYKGLDCYGQDINPLAILLSRVKTGPFDCQSLSGYVDEVIKHIEKDNSEKIDVEFTNIDKWFKKDVSIELSRVRRSIQKIQLSWARNFMWVTFAEVIRLTSNDRTSTYKLHARPEDEIKKRAISPISIFNALIKQNLTDLGVFAAALDKAGSLQDNKFIGNVEISIGDTAKSIALPTSQQYKKYDLVVTSPPYGDNGTTITYGQHSYLPLQWIDPDDISDLMDASFLKSTAEIDRRSLGGNRSKNLLEQINKLSQESTLLAKVFTSLADKPRDRASRVATFYSDFSRALVNIVDVTQVNAYLIWTVGNRRVGGIEIPNDKILQEYLEKLHVKFITSAERTIHQKRMPQRNKITQLMSKERILIFRKTQ